jgi:hypothetical protein
MHFKLASITVSNVMFPKPGPIQLCIHNLGKEGFMFLNGVFNLLKPTGHVMHQQFIFQQLYVLPKLYLCVLYLSENKQRHVPLTA